MELVEGLADYTVKLLNNIRGSEELELVLNKTGGENEEKYSKLARLDLALKYNQKEVNFVGETVQKAGLLSY